MQTIKEQVQQRFDFSPEELARFHELGYYGPFTIYEPDEMAALWRRERLKILDRSKAIYQIDDAVSGVTNISNYDRHLDSDFFAEHICRPQIVDRVASVLGPNVLCWRTEFFPKYPGDEGTDWHQADTFENASGTPQILWPKDQNNVHFGGTITVWTALTEANEETGCLQFIPGTHETMHYDESLGMHLNYQENGINQREKDGVKRGFFGYDYRQLQKDPSWKPDVSQAVSMVMRPGQAILFWSTLMHSSLPNRSKTNQMRIALAARYVPTSVRIYPDTEVVSEYGGAVSIENYGAVLVAGKNEYTHNRIATHTTRGHAFVPR